MPLVFSFIPIGHFLADPLNWDTDVGYPDTPVRCVVNGISSKADYLGGSEAAHPFSHTYEFFHFKPYVRNPTVFEVTLKICHNKKHSENANNSTSVTFYLDV